MELTGVFVPLVTPLDESDSVDLDRVDTIVESMLAAGVHGIVACGTTGEGYSLSIDERREVTPRLSAGARRYARRLAELFAHYRQFNPDYAGKTLVIE